MKRRTYRSIVALAIILTIIPVTSALNNQLEAGSILIDNISDRISTPPVWGDPGNLVLDVPGNDMFIPYFEYAGANFALAKFNSTMETPELFLTSSFADRDLMEEIWIEEDIMAGSKGADILLRDVHGNLYCVEVHSNWQDTRSLTSDDMIIEDLEGEIAVGDVTGDGYKDILHLVPNGSAMELYEGPFPLKKGKAVLMLPDEMGGIASGMDLTGDGISEMVFWHNDGNKTQLMVYYGYTLAPMAILNDDYEIRGVHGGDLDGNLIDDLFLQHDRPGFGEIKVLIDRKIDFDLDLNLEGFSINGNGDHMFTGDENLLVKDLDGDQIADIVIGFPGSGSGKGKVLIQYEPDTHDFDDFHEIILDPDSEISGGSSSDHVGAGIYVNTDIDGDLIPDIVLSTSGDIASLEMPFNDPISSVMKVYFSFMKGKSVSGELFSVINVTCSGVGCNDSMLEVLRANISVEGKDVESWIYLEERKEDSSWFDGSLLLASSTDQGRSINVELGDTVNVEVMGLDGDPITVIGVLGQDDPPVFLDVPDIKVGREAEELLLHFSAKDPEREVIEWSFEALPSWLNVIEEERHRSVYHLDLGGTPDDEDVGWNNFTLTATADGTGVELDIDLYIENAPPYLADIDDELYAREGDLFLLQDLFSSRDITTYSLTTTGVSTDPWLSLHANGTISGTPENRHVGIWDVKIDVTDRNGGKFSRTFMVNATNDAPNIIIPTVSNWRESSYMEINFDSTFEGDGLTYYEMRHSTIPVTLDQETGIVTIESGTIINQGWFQIRIDVLDGHGEWITGALDFDVLNLRPEILNFNQLPTTFKAGEWIRMDLELNHPLYDKDGRYENFGRLDLSVEENSPSFFNGGLTMIEVLPGNIDVGDHRIKFLLTDWEEGAISTYVWDITVEENSSYVDPTIKVEAIGRRGSDLYLDIDYSAMIDISQISISIRVFSGEEFDLIDNFEVPFKNPVTVDISELTSYKIEIKVILEDIFRRETEHVIQVQTDILDDPDGKEGSTMLLVVLAIIIIIILVALASLLFIERTSFVIQSSIFKGGEILEEEVVKPIQDHPGITFTDLVKELDVERKDLLTTINHLESKGMARSVDDGMRIRFYPMMGSFVDGPLALNRFQERILEILYRTKNLNLGELSDASGFPRRKLERELKMLMLKGSVQKVSIEEGTAYNLTRKMKARMRRSKRI